MSSGAVPNASRMYDIAQVLDLSLGAIDQGLVGEAARDLRAQMEALARKRAVQKLFAGREPAAKKAKLAATPPEPDQIKAHPGGGSGGGGAQQGGQEVEPMEVEQALSV